MHIINQLVEATGLEHDTENLTNFVSSLLAMQDPDFFIYLDIPSYAQVIKNIWERFSNKIENPSFCIFDESYFTVLSKDYYHILKTIQYTLKHMGIKTKHLMHPVLKTKRNENGKLLHVVGVDKEGFDDYTFESIVHCFITTPNYDCDQLKEKITNCFKEIIVVNNDYSKCLNQLKTISLESQTEEAQFLELLNSDYYSFYGYRLITQGKSTNQLGLMALDYIDQNPSLNPIDNDLQLNLIKAPIRSTINRCSRYDLIEIKSNEGIHQFIGVFTGAFFSMSAFHIPIARFKVKAIFKHFGFHLEWYNGKFLKMILDSIPLDLFFTLDTKVLLSICQKAISNQKNVCAYINAQENYNSIMVFLPSEKYSFVLKEKIKNYFENLFESKILSEHVLLDEQPFARIFYIQDTPIKKDSDLQKIETDLSLLSETWEEKLVRITDLKTVEDMLSIFPQDYQSIITPNMAIQDYHDYISMKERAVFNLHEKPYHLELHMFSPYKASILAHILPILEGFGLEVLSEASYTLKDQATLQIFTIRKINTPLSFFKERFLTILQSVWFKETENDHLNELAISTSCTRRHLEILRGFIKFAHQTGLKYSVPMMISTLTKHSEFAELFIQYFEERFDPRRTQVNLLDTLKAYCTTLTMVEDDRILKHFVSLAKAVVRTNFYQDKDYISFKFYSKDILNLPKPCPLYEIFVYSPSVEGVHLRGGKVARGGLRFSDRSEDFRSEILGLMKAQMLKNSVIVPVGSKGGFIVKEGDVSRNGVIKAYQTFISGLLDITDNYVQGKLIKPPLTICYDEDDPYLVVAADKGTATFSDIANALSLSYNFWLGDAFASGGSKGYDHKKIGITARGAWVSVERHFKEMGIDVQNEPFTAVGVGDMAGDVFGNGMLRSKYIKLVAAFNHEFIFLDPNPDAEISFMERKRLFETPSLKWSDYQGISEGGGVYSRQSKSIEITKQVKITLDIQDDELAPEDLIQAILKAPVDLLYFGGIGTYIKASFESHTDAQDKANDALRINGKEIRAKVIAEGANLGMTQLSRIEYALRGGRINTDAIDNSAGVDCSDHEVNIKILLNQFVSNGNLTESDRDELLFNMTDDVAELVLDDNKQQTFLLSVLERTTTSEIMGYQALMDTMSKNSVLPLNKKIEFLPDTEELTMRQVKGLGFTRPELAILVSYAKIHLFQKLVISLKEKDYDTYYKGYFPQALQSFDLEKHPLKHEILCTVLANYLINRCGPKFIHSITTIIGEDESNVVDAFFQITSWTGLDTLWDEVTATHELLVNEQYEAWENISHVVRKMILSYLRHFKSFDDHKVLAFKENLEVIINSFLSECAITGCSLKRQLELLMYYPIAFEVCAHHMKTEPIQLSDFAESFKDVSSIMSFDFLLEMQNHNQFSSQWEIGAKFILDDDLLKSIVSCVLKLMCNGTLEEWKNNHKAPFALYESNMNTVKLLYPQNKSNVGLIAFATKQLELFNKQT